MDVTDLVGHGANENAIANFLAGVALSIQVGVAVASNPRILWAIKMKNEAKIYLLGEDGTEVWPVDLIDGNRLAEREVVLNSLARACSVACSHATTTSRALVFSRMCRETSPASWVAWLVSRCAERGSLHQ